MGEPKQAMHKTKTVFPKTGKRKQLKTRFKNQMGLQETEHRTTEQMLAKISKQTQNNVAYILIAMVLM